MMIQKGNPTIKGLKHKVSAWLMKYAKLSTQITLLVKMFFCFTNAETTSPNNAMDMVTFIVDRRDPNDYNALVLA